MQMQLWEYLHSHCSLFSLFSFCCWVASLFIPVSPRGLNRGVTHFHHLHWLPRVTATVCLSKSPAAQKNPLCVCHNKVLKLGVALLEKLCLTLPRVSPVRKYLRCSDSPWKTHCTCSSWIVASNNLHVQHRHYLAENVRHTLCKCFNAYLCWCF